MPIKTLNSLLRAVIDQGYPLEKALQDIGLEFNPLESTAPGDQVPAATYSKLYRLLMELQQDEAFGLGQSYRAPPGTFRMLCLFIVHCTTLGQALQRFWEFNEYCDQFRDPHRSPGEGPLLDLPDPEQVLCLFQRPANLEAGNESISHANVLLMMYRLFSWLIGRELPLLEVTLRGPQPLNVDDYEELFGCPVHFGQSHSGLVLQRSLLLLPVVQNEETLKDFLRQMPYQLVKSQRPDNVDSLSRAVERLLSQFALQKLPNASQVADRLNMSPRTLHRRLTAEGTSFQQLKDNYRRDLAIHYVNRPELTIDAISALMGFQDNSAFYRSFKKWTGVSPGRYRERLQCSASHD